MLFKVKRKPDGSKGDDATQKKRAKKRVNSIIVLNGSVKLNYVVVNGSELSTREKEWFKYLDATEEYYEARVYYDFVMFARAEMTKEYLEYSSKKNDDFLITRERGVGFCAYSIEKSRRDKKLDLIFDLSAKLATEYRRIFAEKNITPKCTVRQLIQLINWLSHYTASQLSAFKKYSIMSVLDVIQDALRDIMVDTDVVMEWNVITNNFTIVVDIINSLVTRVLNEHSEEYNKAGMYNSSILSIQQLRIDRRLYIPWNGDIMGGFIKSLAKVALDFALENDCEEAVLTCNVESGEKQAFIYNGFGVTKYSDIHGWTTPNLLAFQEENANVLSKLRREDHWRTRPMARRLLEFTRETSIKYGPESTWKRKGSYFEIVRHDSSKESFDINLKYFCAETGLEGLVDGLLRDYDQPFLYALDSSENVVGFALYTKQSKTRFLMTEFVTALKSGAWNVAHRSIKLELLHKFIPNVESSIDSIVKIASLAQKLRGNREALLESHRRVLFNSIATSFGDKKFKESDLYEILDIVVKMVDHFGHNEIEVVEPRELMSKESFYLIYLNLVCINPKYSGYGVLAAIFRYLVYEARRGWADNDTDSAYIALTPVNSEKAELYGSLGFFLKMDGLMWSHDLTKPERPGLRIYEEI